MPGRRRRRRCNKSSEDPTTGITTSATTTGGYDGKNIDLPAWFQLCKTRQIFEYDTKRYPFKELYADWLGVSPNELHRIHTVPSIKGSNEPIHPKIVQAWKNASMIPKLSVAARNSDTSTQQKLFQSQEYHRLINTYRLFVREVIAPMCCCDNNNSNISSNDGNNVSSSIETTTTASPSDVVYQCPPTTRVVLPMGKRTIAIHSDKEYKDHQPAEINFWIPLTKVWGSNALWLESSPGEGDFTPQELDYGQFLRFNGYECRHYTILNDGTNTCRVSFDFRVIPSQLCLQRQRIGDFCVEETTSGGYISYPHKFWMITGQGSRNNNAITNPQRQQQDNEEQKPYHTTLSSLCDSLALL